MIWFKSFGRALGTALEFGAMGGFLGAAVNGIWGVVAGWILIVLLLFMNNIAYGDIFSLLLIGFYLGALTGFFVVGLVLAGYGFIKGFYPQKPNFYRIFRTVIWGGWLCLLAGSLTILVIIGIRNVIDGTGQGTPTALKHEQYIVFGLISCFSIGCIVGAATPDYVERFIKPWNYIRKQRNAERSS